MKNKLAVLTTYVTLVTDKLKRQWLSKIYMVYFANYIRKPDRKLPRPSYNQIYIL